MNLFNKLPNCDTLFKKYLDHWYPENERRGMTRPDIYTIAAFKGVPLQVNRIQYLPPDILLHNQKMVDSMIVSAKNDFQDIVAFNDFSIEIIDKIDKHFDKKKVIELIKKSDPKDFSNQYLVTVCEFGSMLGEMFTRQPDFKWLYSYPYFNSIIVHQSTGTGVTVYDWAIKKFSSYGIDDGFAAKLQHAIKIIPEEQSGIGIATYNT